jgi:hypothetical protein
MPTDRTPAQRLELELEHERRRVRELERIVVGLAAQVAELELERRRLLPYARDEAPPAAPAHSPP